MRFEVGAFLNAVSLDSCCTSDSVKRGRESYKRDRKGRHKGKLSQTERQRGKKISRRQRYKSRGKNEIARACHRWREKETMQREKVIATRERKDMRHSLSGYTVHQVIYSDL